MANANGNANSAQERVFLIKESEAQAVLNYLTNCPYKHVYLLVEALANLKPATSQVVASGATTSGSTVDFARATALGE